MDPQALLSETREELARADQKAAMLLSALLVAGGVVAGAALAGGWSPADLSDRWRSVWWAAEAVAAFAVVCLGAAVWPRLGPRPRPGGSSYYRELARFEDATALRKALTTQSEDDRSSSQLLSVSRIVRTKYAFVRVGMAATGVAAALAVLAGAAGS